MTDPSNAPEGEPEPVVEPVETNPVDDAGVSTSSTTGVPVDEVAVLREQLDERTADLQRLQAEYLNYKRRVDRDRELVQQNASYRALAPITEVLDTIDRAREHGPLDDGLKAVAEQLQRAVATAGLTRFGDVGDAFDPTIHEALSHIGEDPEVSVTTCKVIAKAGYRIGDRVLRAAQVLVVDPAGPVDGPVETEDVDEGVSTRSTNGEPEHDEGVSTSSTNGVPEPEEGLEEVEQEE